MNAYCHSSDAVDKDKHERGKKKEPQQLYNKSNLVLIFR